MLVILNVYTGNKRLNSVHKTQNMYKNEPNIGFSIVTHPSLDCIAQNPIEVTHLEGVLIHSTQACLHGGARVRPTVVHIVLKAK